MRFFHCSRKSRLKCQQRPVQNAQDFHNTFKHGCQWRFSYWLDDLFMVYDYRWWNSWWWPGIKQQIESIATEIVSKEEIIAGFQCNECDKVCISQRNEAWQDMWRNAKHLVASAGSEDQLLSSEEISGNKFHSLQLKVIVSKCAETLSNDLCFPLPWDHSFQNKSFHFQLMTPMHCYQLL